MSAACAGFVDAAGHTEKVALSQGDWSGIEGSLCQMTADRRVGRARLFGMVRTAAPLGGPPGAPAGAVVTLGRTRSALAGWVGSAAEDVVVLGGSGRRLGSRVLEVRSHR